MKPTPTPSKKRSIPAVREWAWSHDHVLEIAETYGFEVGDLVSVFAGPAVFLEDSHPDPAWANPADRAPGRVYGLGLGLLLCYPANLGIDAVIYMRELDTTDDSGFYSLIDALAGTSGRSRILIDRVAE